MKRKIGDKVKIREDLIVGDFYGSGINFTSDMCKCLGMKAEIISVGTDYYQLNLDKGIYVWSEKMIEEDTSNIKSGYIDQSVLDEARRVWGSDSQLEMIEEECMELALAVHRLKRLRGDMTEKVNNVIDEIADVKIIIQQAEKLFDSEAINKRVDFKMDRLVDRLFEYKNK